MTKASRQAAKVREALAAGTVALARSRVGADESGVRGLVAAAAELSRGIDAGLPAMVDGAVVALVWSESGSLRQVGRFVRACGRAADEFVRERMRRRGAEAGVSLLPIAGAFHVLLASAQRALLRRAREIEAQSGPAAAAGAVTQV